MPSNSWRWLLIAILRLNISLFIYIKLIFYQTGWPVHKAAISKSFSLSLLNLNFSNLTLTIIIFFTHSKVSSECSTKTIGLNYLYKDFVVISQANSFKYRATFCVVELCFLGHTCHLLCYSVLFLNTYPPIFFSQDILALLSASIGTLTNRTAAG